MSVLWRSWRLIASVAPRTVAALGVLGLVEALLPAANVWLLKQIIDVVAAAGHGRVAVDHVTVRGGLGDLIPRHGPALVLAGCYLLLVCVQQSVRAISQFLQGQVRDELAGQVTLRVMQKAASCSDLTPFETPRFHDQLQLLQKDVAYRPMYLFNGLTQGAQATVTLLCMAIYLAGYHPAIVAVLGLTAAPGILYQRWLYEAAWWGLKDVVPLRRRLNDYARILLTAPFAKEVRLFGFAEHIVGRYREQFGELRARVQRIRWRLVSASIGFSLLAAVGVGGAFAYVINRALQGAFTLGDLSLYTGALFQANAAAAGLAAALGAIHEMLPFMRELFAFLDTASPEKDSPPASLEAQSSRRGPQRKADLSPRRHGDTEKGRRRRKETPSQCVSPFPLCDSVSPWCNRPVLSLRTAADLCASSEAGGESFSPSVGFRFEGVSFRYPETERAVFEGLDLEIPAGMTTAIVGENGAGKSTLVKLLTRLYDPSAGRVTLDGIDLREYDPEELRRQIGVVFQDFARYHMPLWENIALGDVSRLFDRERIAAAAEKGGVDALIRRLPRGLDTMLGREFDGGQELSGGEWQKIALARAFMRDAPILILDEPTSALDPRAEYDLYCRFLELARGRTTLLITHRFSTVQMADRIVVLEEGRVVEQGSHQGLLDRGGRYAELYGLQASRFSTAVIGSAAEPWPRHTP